MGLAKGRRCVPAPPQGAQGDRRRKRFRPTTTLSVPIVSTHFLRGSLGPRRSVASLLPGRGGTLVPTSRQAVLRSLQTAREGRSGLIPEEEIPPRILDTPHEPSAIHLSPSSSSQSRNRLGLGSLWKIRTPSSTSSLHRSGSLWACASTQTPAFTASRIASR